MSKEDQEERDELPYDGARVRRLEVRAVKESRPGGSAPDKRTKIDPAPCDIPKRTSDTVLF